jgi:hypothetical protein
MEEASATSVHEIRMIRSKERGACEGRRVSLARIEGDEQSGCRGSAISVGRVLRKPSGPPGASLNASPLRPRVEMRGEDRYASKDSSERPTAAWELYFGRD